MKVGVFLSDVLPADGGGFSYTERLISAIDKHSFHKELNICFVGRGHVNATLDKPYHKISSRLFYRFFYLLKRLSVLEFFDRAFRLNINLSNRKDKALLKKLGIDILLYPRQNFSEIDDFPFISMNWDIGHKSTFAFPELILDRNFEHRQAWYMKELHKALAIFVESENGRQELSRLCLIPEIKIKVVPIFPGKVVDLLVSDSEQLKILHGLQLSGQQYFYYPAQFWAHKNHYNLIIAFKKLLDANSGLNLKLVFTGSDKGNKSYIQSVVKENNLERDVLMLKFLLDEEVYTLYKNAVALVMPTFLGPTNMPLLEAQALSVPVICSDFAGHREICGDGAIYIEPANSNSIFEAMHDVLNDERRRKLVASGKEVYAKSNFKIDNCIQALDRALIDIKPIRKTFS